MNDWFAADPASLVAQILALADLAFLVLLCLHLAGRQFWRAYFRRRVRLEVAPERVSLRNTEAMLGLVTRGYPPAQSLCYVVDRCTLARACPYVRDCQEWTP